jgi:hypothetical protein
MRRRISLLFALAVTGCGGGGSGLYLDTDVREVEGFRNTSAKEIQMSGGHMQQGTLEFSGSGDLKEVFTDYVAAMKDVGWSIANVDVQGDRAVGMLRKDNRSCNLEFIKASERIRATIRVGAIR